MEEYSEAAVEVLDILNYTDEKDLEKVPQSFIRFLSDISSRNYKVKFNHEQPINSLNLRDKTKELLGFIYITWWCDENELEEYKKVLYINKLKDKKEGEVCDINDMFKNKRENQNHTIIKNESIMTVYKQENLFKRITNKILHFFLGSKNERS